MDPQKQAPAPKGDQYVNYAQNSQVQTQVPPQSQTPSSSAPSTPPVAPKYQVSRKGNKKLIIILCILIFLVASTAYAFFFVISPDWAIPMALSKIDNSDKSHTAVSFSLSPDSAYFPGSKLSVSSDFDRTNPNSVSLQSAIDLTSKDFEATVEVKIVDDVLYFRMTKIPEALSQYMKEVNIQNVWSSLKFDTIKKYTSNSSYGSSTEILSKIGERPSVEQAYKKLVDAGVLSKLSFKGISKDQGSSVRKYSAMIDKDKLADYLAGKTSESLKGNAMGEQYASSLKSSVRASLTGLTFSPIIITTSLWTGVIKGMTMDITYSSPYLKTASSASDKITLHTSTEYKINNKNFVITAPDGALPLDNMVIKSLESSREKGTQALIKARLSSLRVYAELYYDKSFSYAGFCNDKKDIPTILADIKAKGSTVTCKDSTKSYVIYATLPDSSTTIPQYYCVDYSGYAMQITKTPLGYKCK